MKHNNYPCHVPHLWNSIACNHDFWYTYVKWWYLNAFLFVHFFKIVIFWIFSGVKAKNGPEDKNSVCCSLYLRKHRSYVFNLWCNCVKWWYLQRFFCCIKILVFWVVSRVKGQKMVQNEKKILFVVLHISGTIHHMFFIYGRHVQNDISRCFFIFSKLWFSRLLGSKRAKNDPKWKKIVCHAPYLRNQTSYVFHLWYTCIKWWHLQMVFSIFFLILVFQVKGQKMAQSDKKVCCTAYLRNLTSYDCRL